jgi:uncharacterized membrane protein
MALTRDADARWRHAGPLVGVLALGMVVRTILVPITYGPDFTVWNLASRATIGGVNVYAHHPAYTGGPYTYLPLFLYVELPFQWLAMHTGVPFTILGKLPIVAADLGATLLIIGEVRRHGAGERATVVAVALFFLNPLVLYNGAFYGRFDSVAIALLLLAVRLWHSRATTAGWRSSASYALAVAAKTYPIFLLPWVIRHGRRKLVRILVVIGAVLLAVAAPYIVLSPAAFATDLLYSADKLPGGLSWQVVLHVLPASAQVGVGAVLLGVFALAAIALAAVDDVTVAAAAILVLFLLLSKQVIEQYLLWPLPFLVMLAAGRRSRSAWWLVGELTVAGMLVNAHFHPFGVQPAAFNVLFGITVAVSLGRLLATERGRRPARGQPAPQPATVTRPTLAVGSES